MSRKKPLAIAALTGITILGFMLFKHHSTQAGNESSSAGRPEVAVETMTADFADMADTVDVVGTLSPKIQTDVKAEYGGVVREVHVSEWVRVKKGDPLVSLDTREPQAMLNKAKAAVDMERANLLQAKVAVSRAEREYNRMVQLKESGLATSQSVDEAGTEKDASMARKASVVARLTTAQQDLAQAKLRFSKNVITSPINGIVAERKINKGDMATDKPIFKIVDNRILDLTVTVPSKFMSFMKPGLELRFTTDAFPGKTFSGKLKYINPVVSEGDRSMKIIAEVQNPSEALKGGLFIKGQIVIGHRQHVVQIPRNALINWNVENKRAEILVVNNGVAKKKNVGVGIIQGDKVEITSGIVPGDQVILRGGFNIKEGDKVRKNGGK
ncbi:MAG: efflux RND transporter periplasmic adaptor subunit [Desulfobacteraceae bacterium]|jgi:RND family efflux transporter MFP subunit